MEHPLFERSGLSFFSIDDALNTCIESNYAAISTDLPPMYTTEYDVHVAASPASCLVWPSNSSKAARGIRWYNWGNSTESNRSMILPLYEVSAPTRDRALITTHAPLHYSTLGSTESHHFQCSDSEDCKPTGQQQQAGYQGKTNNGKRLYLLERNRIAARKYREKKKMDEDDVRKMHAYKEKENADLQLTVTYLRREILQLKSTLLEHSECGDPIISYGINHLVTQIVGESGGCGDIEAENHSDL